MAEITKDHFSSSLKNAMPPVCGKPQQGAGSAGLTAVAAPTPCDNHKSIRVLRLPEVIARVGLKRASIYLHMAKGSFPKSIAIGARAVGWLDHEINAWLAARIEARRKI